jgi:hypothetical protein
MFAPKNARLRQHLETTNASSQRTSSGLGALWVSVFNLSPLRCHPEPRERSAFLTQLYLPHITARVGPHTNSRNPISFMGLLHTSLYTWGTGSTTSTRHPKIAIPFRIRTYAKHTHNPSGMSTSKTKHLKPFRMSTYRKTPGGDPRHSQRCHHSLFPTHYSPLTASYGIRRILCSFCFELAARPCNSFNPPIPQLARNGKKHNSRDCSTLCGYSNDSKNS